MFGLFSRRLSTKVVDATGRTAKVCAVLGAQWGDEGKGKLADVLASCNFDIVARFNGGNNAGHTLVVNGKKHAFHLLPCGLGYKNTLNLLGNGVVVHLPGLFKEIDNAVGTIFDPTGRLVVSDRSHILFDFHQALDAWQEQARGPSKSIGTTRKGIGPAYTSKATRNSIRMGDLVAGEWDLFAQKYLALASALDRQFPGLEYDKDKELANLKVYRQRLLDGNMVVDSALLINQALSQGKRILAEGANAVMLDLDFGTYPYVTSSSTSAGGVCTGLGIPPNQVECTVGVVKAYTTRVGGGPFPTELTDDLCGGDIPRGSPGTDIGALLQRVGQEIGVTTGRKRRCGWLDLVVLRYSHALNGYSGLNITKLDVLDSLKEVKLGVAYEIDGKVLPNGQMPSRLEDLAKVKVVYETMPGWEQDISKITKYSDLPVQARNYVERIEQLVGVKVSWVGVGAGREAMLVR
ncbi:adenylosuccinate synthase [Batrachochytrium salamandrivorans]|nr:adenylosuccinate synthase [Batrachochytrium salamandrivorans]